MVEIYFNCVSILCHCCLYDVEAQCYLDFMCVSCLGLSLGQA